MHQGRHLDKQPYKTIINKKDLIICELMKKGLKITNQRKLLIDIIIENNCSCCKEIYYKALLKDPAIGIATVYRLVKNLEEIGAIDRKNLYQISYENLNGISNGQIILIDKEKVTELKAGVWYDSLKQTLKSNGYIGNHEISVVIKKSS
jgi:Fur family ferric uptake transcriptional regulator